MIDIKKLWLCQYSMKLRYFQIIKMKDALKLNGLGITHDNGLDYIPFAVTDDYKKAEAYCDRMFKAMRKGYIEKAEYLCKCEKPFFCRRPEIRGCRGCEYNYVPEGCDGGCMLSKEAEEGEDK